MDNKLISVIIPSYNRKDLICRAIDSVLNQSYKDVEVVVVDDGSTDGTFEFIQEQYKGSSIVKVYKNEKNSGAGVSRKNGYKKSNGGYIVFMDDDDYYTNFDFYKHAVEIFESMDNVGMVSSSSTIEYVKENKFEESKMNINGFIEKSEYLSEFQLKYMKSNSTFTTVFRRATLDQANFNDVEMVNDSSIYLRALLAGDAFVLDEISGIYRIHSKNITFSLKIGFIIENLDEKKKVYDEIVKRNLLPDPSEWLKRQVLLTASYYVENNDISDEDYEKLIKWCENNCQDKVTEVIERLQEIKEKK